MVDRWITVRRHTASDAVARARVVELAARLALRQRSLMRSGEAVLLLADLMTLFVVAVRLPRRMHWLRYAAPTALLAAFAQVLIEGPRWQLVPAYVTTGLFFLIWLRRRGPVGVSSGWA